jgi:hypothetical protein
MEVAILILPTGVSIYQVAEVIAVYSQDAEAVECVRNAINEPWCCYDWGRWQVRREAKVGSGRSGVVALETYRREQINKECESNLSYIQ